MAVKDTVLKTLKENRNKYISGEELASELGVSRAAVGKAVKVLREEGYPIEAVTNKGYLMPAEGKDLTEEGVRRALPKALRKNSLYVYQSIDSTNLRAKKLLLVEGEGCTAGKAGHGSVVISGQQTAGRGRLGRSFYSPKDGLYMSVIIKPEFDMDKSGLVTVAAAVAASEAIDEICGCESQIKWVNDIYLNGKKICGILTEAMADFESGQIDSLIIGIGINTSSVEFPEELRDYAGRLEDVDGSAKAKRAAAITEKVLTYTAQIAEGSSVAKGKGFLDRYRNRCMVIGREINVYKGTYRKDPTMEIGGIPAKAIDIDEAVGLVVKYKDGKKETLTTGEVSIRTI